MTNPPAPKCDNARTDPQAPRICTLLESYFPVVGGMETQALNMTGIFLELGVGQIVVTRRTSGELARSETVRDIPVYRAGPCGKSSKNRWFFLFTCLPLLVRHRREYDVILVPGFRVLGMAAVLAGKLLGKKVLLKAECIGEMSGSFFTGGLQSVKMNQASRLFRWFLRARNAWLRGADVFVSLYREMSEEYREYGVPQEKIHLIPQSVDDRRYEPPTPEQRLAFRRQLGLPEERFLMVYTGRIVTYKGVPLLLEVWKRIGGEFPGAGIIIVGEGGVDMFACEEQVRSFVKENKMEEQVIFTGAVRNVDEYLKASDLFVLPTQNDAFPLCVLEAMATGLPIVTTPVGALGDVIQDGQNGLLTTPGDGASLEQALRRLLNDPALRRKLGEQARRDALARYTREQVARQYIELARP